MVVELKTIEGWAKSCQTESQINNVMLFLNKKKIQYSRQKGWFSYQYQIGFTSGIIAQKITEIMFK